MHLFFSYTRLISERVGNGPAVCMLCLKDVRCRNNRDNERSIVLFNVRLSSEVEINEDLPLTAGIKFSISTSRPEHFPTDYNQLKDFIPGIYCILFQLINSS